MGDRLSLVDFGVREDEQGPQEGGRVPGVHADVGEKAPGLQVRETVLDGGAFAVSRGQGAESCRTQRSGDLVVAGGGDLAEAARLGRGDPDQVALLVGERETQQAMNLVLAG
ncbi:hypothetical protein ACFYO0_10435 [Streptomyces sp. NPDC006365]|uniref:hypothetical protein n=1 Tax=Streptomyces sp. NPDC006365 TaxID=3364744 RepID=UPI0036A8EAB5